MTAPNCTAPNCDRPTPNAFLCANHTRALQESPLRIATYYAELDTVLGKQTRLGGNRGGKTVGKVQPLVIDMRFADDTGHGSRLKDEADNTITTWARICLDEWPEDVAAGTRSACIYLAKVATKIATQQWASEVLDELTHIERRLRKFVDRPAQRWYAGRCGAVLEPEEPHDGTTCGCGCHNGPNYVCDVPGGCGLEYLQSVAVECERDLWAEPGKRWIRCGDCGGTWDVDDRRERMLVEAEDYNATVAMIARIVTTLGDRDVSVERLAKRIRDWAHRGRIKSYGTRPVMGHDRPAYRVGDVIELLREDARAG